MKRQPKQTKREKRGDAGPCSRGLAEQDQDRSGAARRTNHPALAHYDLMLDERRAAFDARFPEAAEAIPAAVAIEAAKLTELFADEASDAQLEERFPPGMPHAAAVVCAQCGRYEAIVRLREWSIVRAQKRVELADRDARAIVDLLRTGWGNAPDLDTLSDPALLALRDAAYELIRKPARSAAEVRERIRASITRTGPMPEALASTVDVEEP